MEIKKEILRKYLHQIAIDQLSEEYEKEGYQVDKEVNLGLYRADLVAQKGDETIVFEVKTGKMTPYTRKKIESISKYINSRKNHKFKIVIATTPKEKEIEIPDIESLLLDELLNNLPSKLDELSTHTRVEEVTDIEIQQIIIKNDNEIFVKGEGTVSVELQMGSDSDIDNDIGYTSNESFPINYELILEYDSAQELSIKHVEYIDVDTNTFYE